jgi:DNA-binding PucR family transcriptional regulator
MPVRRDDNVGWTVLIGDVSHELTRIRTRLEGMVGDGPVLGATGPVVTGVKETARSFQEAETVLALLRQMPGRVEITHASLGLTGLLLAVGPERLQAFVDQHLGPILERPDLLDTLEAWLRCQGSRSAVADALNLHRNSVGYRMSRIRDRLGVDPLDAEAALRLQSALVARTVLLALQA